MIELHRSFQNLYFFLAGASVCFVFLAVFSVVDITSASGVVAAILAFVVLLTPVYFIIRKILREIWSHEIRFIKGEKGEGRVYFELQKLPDSFVVIQNMQLGGAWNIDFVVVGRRKIFVVEVRSHSGTIEFDGESLVRDGKFFEKKILKQARSQAFSISEFILKNTNKNVWVEPVVVFTGTTKIHFGRKKIGGVYVIGISWLNSLLSDKDRVGQALDGSLKKLLIQQDVDVE